MSLPKNDDKTLHGSQEHLEHVISHQKEGKTGAGTLDQVLANGFGTHISNEDRAAALKMAHAADPGPDIYSWRYMKFVMLALVACVCSGDNGAFDHLDRHLILTLRLRWHGHEFSQLNVAIQRLL